MTSNGRYQGKPLLRLLESYVLLAIGELDERSKATLEKMQPYLAKTYSCDGSWDQIVARALALPDELPLKIRELWQHNGALTPQEFAERFVDANLGGR